jgi:hypothetical protein
MRRWPQKLLTAPQRLAWKRLLCMNHNFLRFRAEDGKAYFRCDNCGATIPQLGDETPTKEKR